MSTAVLTYAIQAGVQAEMENIARYDRSVTQKPPDDARRIFGWLKAAPQDHMAAFRNDLSRY